MAVVAAAGFTTYALLNSGRARSESGLPRGAAPLCRSSQLSVRAIWDGAAGHLLNFFTITNKGAAACSVPSGRPTVLLTRAGSQLEVEEQTLTDNQYPGESVNSLAPGRRAVVHLSWWNWCGPQVAFAQTRTTVTVQFVGGLRVTAPHLLGQPPCIVAGQPSVISVSQLMTPN